MVPVVAVSERAAFESEVIAMYRHRKRVFVDRLGWRLSVTEGDLEIDQFDGAAVYLLAVDEGGAVRGSLRLLPSTGPHLLGDLFPHLCDEGVPRGSNIWEVSRFCTDPDLEDPRLARKELLVGLVEFALLHEVDCITCVSHELGLQQLAEIGWETRRLGPLADDCRSRIGALAIHIGPGTLGLLRRQAGFTAPVLRIGARHAA